MWDLGDDIWEVQVPLASLPIGIKEMDRVVFAIAHHSTRQAAEAEVAEADSDRHVRRLVTGSIEF